MEKMLDFTDILKEIEKYQNGTTSTLSLVSLMLLVIPFINILSLFYLIYFYFAVDFRLARAFGHTFFFGLGLIFFNTICILILGFSQNKYQKSNI